MLRPIMTKEALVASVKVAVGLGKEGKLDEMYAAYQKLFTDPNFGKNRQEDQRQALRLMVHAKNAPPKPTPALLEAHRAAVQPLTELVSLHSEPADFEMLGMCHVLLGNEQSAAGMFRAGLKIERERSPGSDLCGDLMRRVSLI
jgi:hypothetical protein